MEEKIQETKKNVVCFAGAHGKPETEALAYKLGKALAASGFRTITGGGPGIMRAINRGAFEAGGDSWGICIRYRAEQADTSCFTYHEFLDTFDTRNDRLLELGNAFIILPGGLGTVAEALQISQRKKFKELPEKTPLLFLSDFYRSLDTLFQEIKTQGYIAENLSDLYSFVKDPKETIDVLTSFFSS